MDTESFILCFLSTMQTFFNIPPNVFAHWMQCHLGKSGAPVERLGSALSSGRLLGQSIGMLCVYAS